MNGKTTADGPITSNRVQKSFASRSLRRKQIAGLVKAWPFVSGTEDQLIEGGMSGSPILDADGAVIGLVSARREFAKDWHAKTSRVERRILKFLADGRLATADTWEMQQIIGKSQRQAEEARRGDSIEAQAWGMGREYAERLVRCLASKMKQQKIN